MHAVNKQPWVNGLIQSLGLGAASAETGVKNTPSFEAGIGASARQGKAVHGSLLHHTSTSHLSHIDITPGPSHPFQD
jgi:hypothetical protein